MLSPAVVCHSCRSFQINRQYTCPLLPGKDACASADVPFPPNLRPCGVPMERLRCLGCHHSRHCVRLSPALQGMSALPCPPHPGIQPRSPPSQPWSATAEGCVWRQSVRMIMHVFCGGCLVQPPSCLPPDGCPWPPQTLLICYTGLLSLLCRVTMGPVHQQAMSGI